MSKEIFYSLKRARARDKERRIYLICTTDVLANHLEGDHLYPARVLEAQRKLREKRESNNQ